MEQFKQLGLIFLAGGFGTLARYGVSSGVYALLGRNFPWGTIAVNIIGCFLFGLVWDLAAVRQLIHDAHREILLVGFMGSFTTFSTFIFDSHILWRSSSLLGLACNLLVQIIVGFLALRAGMLLAS